MSDSISRQAAICILEDFADMARGNMLYDTEEYFIKAVEWFKALPSTQPEQTKMIKEIRKWINSGNRGSADYFIVDKIEEIINKYE